MQRVQEFTIGFWQDIYKGDLGRARVGLQYEYVALTCSLARRPFPVPPLPVVQRLTAAANTGLHPNNNIVFFSLRYYPFN